MHSPVRRRSRGKRRSTHRALASEARWPALWQGTVGAVSADWIELLATGPNADGSLTIELLPPLWVRDENVLGPEHLYPPDAPWRETWVEVRLGVEAHPVSATFEDVWFAADVEALGVALLALARDSQKMSTVAGGRALELRVGGGESCTENGRTFFEATLLGPSSDAPCVQLTWWPQATEDQLTLAGERAVRLATDWRAGRRSG